MSPTVPARRSRPQAGFTLLMVVFMVAAMMIAAAAITPNLLTQGRREKEREMVWRGQQYARAIGLYYKKFGKYPTKIEDLTQQTNGVRFLRQAYKDPMNADDGAWRFIYVGPNGQLIGSLRQTNLLQSALNTPAGSALSAFGGGMQMPALPGAAGAQNQGLGAPGVATPGIGTTGIGAPGQNTNSAAAANPLESQPQPLDGQVLGGNIIGVGSKIKKSSIRIYQGGITYQQWEFIWNPVGQTGIPGQTPVNPNANPTGAPNANGAAPGAAGTNSVVNPGGANPNATNPNSPDGQQPQNPQAPVVNMPPPTQ
jgi:type II secretory pathway pseudopilin PulG